MQGLNYKNIAFSVIFALVCLISVCFFWRETFLLTMILLIISGIGLYKWRNKETIVLFAISGILGIITESTAVYFGAWAYASPDFVGIPYWLPVLWGNASMFIYQIAIEIRNLRL